MADLTIEHDDGGSRYVALLDGNPIGEAVYRDGDEGRVFTHSEILPEHEHHGFGTRMVQEALDDTRKAGLLPIGQCSMVQHFLSEHPDYSRPLDAGAA